jgi:hypothetical protein
VLILGSTVEFRDWAYEERVDATVVDYSVGFHTAVSNERRHHNPYESVVISDWREMSFDSEFDMAVGDLVIGNVPSIDLPMFLERIRRALRPSSRFVTKSFFAGEDAQDQSLEEALAVLCRPEHEFADPFPLIAYELVMACMDHETGVLRFAEMLSAIEAQWAQGLVSGAHMERFREFGWDGEMKIEFSVPTLDQWRQLIATSFQVEQEIHDDAHTCHRHVPLFELSPIK